jgi:hypothetical protein
MLDRLPPRFLGLWLAGSALVSPACIVSASLSVRMRRSFFIQTSALSTSS